MGIGMQELIIILVIVLIVFGAGKLPEVGDALGRGIRNFRKASSGQDDKAAQPAPPQVSAPESKKLLDAAAEKIAAAQKLPENQEIGKKT